MVEYPHGMALCRTRVLELINADVQAITLSHERAIHNVAGANGNPQDISRTAVSHSRSSVAFLLYFDDMSHRQSRPTELSCCRNPIQNMAV